MGHWSSRCERVRTRRSHLGLARERATALWFASRTTYGMHYRVQQAALRYRLGQICENASSHTLLTQPGCIERGNDDYGGRDSRETEHAVTSAPGNAAHKSSTRHSGGSAKHDSRNSLPETQPRETKPAAFNRRTSAFRTDSSSSTTTITSHTPNKCRSQYGYSRCPDIGHQDTAARLAGRTPLQRPAPCAERGAAPGLFVTQSCPPCA